MEKKVNDIAVKQMQALRKAGHSIRAIAERFGLHSNTVANYTRELSTPRKTGKHLEQAVIDEMKELYRYGLEPHEIAYELNISSSSVHHHIKPLKELAKPDPPQPEREGPQAMHRFDCLSCAASLNWWFDPDNLLNSWKHATQRCEKCGRVYKAHQVISREALRLPEDAINNSY